MSTTPPLAEAGWVDSLFGNSEFLRIFVELFSQSASPARTTRRLAFKLSGSALVCLVTLCTDFHGHSVTPFVSVN